MLQEGQAEQLEDADLTSYNHNMNSYREFYPSVICTRSYDERIQTLEFVRNAGLKNFAQAVSWTWVNLPRIASVCSTFCHPCPTSRRCAHQRTGCCQRHAPSGSKACGNLGNGLDNRHSQDWDAQVPGGPFSWTRQVLARRGSLVGGLHLSTIHWMLRWHVNMHMSTIGVASLYNRKHARGRPVSSRFCYTCMPPKGMCQCRWSSSERGKAAVCTELKNEDFKMMKL